MTEFLLVWRRAGRFGQHSYMANDRAMSVILDHVMEPGSAHFSATSSSWPLPTAATRKKRRTCRR